MAGCPVLSAAARCCRSRRCHQRGPLSPRHGGRTKPAPFLSSRRSAPSPCCPNNCPDGSCSRSARVWPAPPGAPRWRTGGPGPQVIRDTHPMMVSADAAATTGNRLRDTESHARCWPPIARNSWRQVIWEASDMGHPPNDGARRCRNHNRQSTARRRIPREVLAADRTR